MWYPIYRNLETNSILLSRELMDLRRRVGELRTQTASADGNGTNGAAASGGTSVRQSSWVRILRSLSTCNGVFGRVFTLL